MGPPKVIAGDGFKGTDLLSAADLRKLCANSTRDACDRLLGNWDGRVLAAVTMKLSNDNRAIANTQITLIGDLLDGQSKSFKASKFWDTAVSLSLLIHNFDASKFIFGSSLTSELIDSGVIPHSFVAEGSNEPLAAEDVAEAGIPGFSLRCHLYPISSAHVKMNIVLFPLPVQQLLTDFPLVESALFPGLNAIYGDIQLHPASTRVLPHKRWGSPVSFFLLGSSPPADSDTIPSTAEFKAALAALLRAVTKPDCKANASFLAAKWSQINDSGASALSKKPVELIWPEFNAGPLNHQGTTSFQFPPPPP